MSHRMVFDIYFFEIACGGGFSEEKIKKVKRKTKCDGYFVTNCVACIEVR